MQNANDQELTFQSLNRPLSYRFFNTLGSGLNAVGLSKFDLDVSSLLDAAEKATQFSDFGNQDFRTPLEHLIESLKSEAQLNFVGKRISRNILIELLSERLRIQQYLKVFPETLSEKINCPLFVIGIPRSGTSFLFNLLCQDPNSSWIKYWELQTPPQEFFQGEQPNQAFAESALIDKSTQDLAEKKRLMPQLDRVHPVNALEAYECFRLLERGFISHTFGLYANVPSYIKWIESACWGSDSQTSTDLYQYYYQQIQVIKNLRSRSLEPQSLDSELEKHWVFKSPVHLGFIDRIASIFPDIHFVHIHRDPLSVIPSICSFAALGRSVLSDQVDLQHIGERALERWSKAINRSLDIRQRDSSLKIIDVRYKDFIENPVATIQTIYCRLGYDFTPQVRSSLEAYIVRSKKSKQGQQHKYSLQQFGLKEEEVRESFRDYYQFMNSI